MAFRPQPVSGSITLISIPVTGVLYWIAYHRGGIWMAAAGTSFLVTLVGLMVQFSSGSAAEETSETQTATPATTTASPQAAPKLPDWVPATKSNPYPASGGSADPEHDQQAFRRRVRLWLEGLGYTFPDESSGTTAPAVDLIGVGQGERVAVATRDADQVGAKEARRFYDELKRGGFSRGYLVTSGTFSEAARQFASLCPELHLVEGAALSETESPQG